MKPAERMMGKLTARRGERALGALALLGLAVTAVMGLVVAPPDRPPPVGQGDLYRIMYVHVPAAWLAYLCFAVVFVASIAYLRTGRSRWDRLAAASAEIGVVFTALAIALGSIWGRPAWGTWWTWDPRLTTTAILLLIYVGYLAVRKLSDNPRRRGRWAAVVGIVGFADVPIVHLSVTWWRGLHQGPTVKLPSVTLAPMMTTTLLVAVAAFTVLYAYLLTLRLRVGRLEERALAEALSPRLGQPVSTLVPDGNDHAPERAARDEEVSPRA
ncbi:MAG: cytochrome c biogenesis protein CcsA [Actinomycetota bacterium]